LTEFTYIFVYNGSYIRNSTKVTVKGLLINGGVIEMLKKMKKVFLY